MLKRKDSSALRSAGLATLHDHWLTSLSGGEPFYESGVLAYFDGRMVTIGGFPLRDCAPPPDAALRDVTDRWVSERKAEAVLFIGTRPFRNLVKLTSGLRLIAEAHRPVISAELLIDCGDRRAEARSRSRCRLGRASGLRLKTRAGGAVSSQHFALVEKFYRLRRLSAFLADVSFIIPVLLRSGRVYLVEAWDGRRLAGFLMMHRPFDAVAVATFLFHDHFTEGVSDLLYHGMLEHARALGARYVNVGASPTRGQYDFKVKWGGMPLVPPYHCAVWARGHLARRNYISWGPRLVGL